MRRSTAWTVAPLVAGGLLACSNEGTLISEEPTVDLVVDSPTYGEFLGDDTVEVRGSVTPAFATLTVEGEPVPVGEDGRFELVLPVEHAYRIVELEATVPARRGVVTDAERLPVFRGHHPMDTWPGGTVMRFTPGGLDVIGKSLGAAIDATGWEQQLLTAAPAFDLGFVTVTPTAIEHEPTVVFLIPHEGGIDMAATLIEVALIADVALDIGGVPVVLPARFVYDEIALGATITPALDEAGVITMSLSDADIVFGTPSVELVGIGGLPLDFLLGGLTSLIEPLGEGLIDGLLGQFDGLELGGPFEFQTDLFGTSLDVRLSELYTDSDGVAAGLGMGIGEPAATGPLGIPAPVEPDPAVHLALGLHEAILDQALSEQILGLVTQDLDLAGLFGNVIGAGITALPGGDDAPEAEGWCLALNPGTAHVVRLQEGIAPLAVLYMPDVFVDVGVMQGGACQDWLQASLAMEVGIDVRDGTAVGISMAVPEGAVLFYGADEDEWTEAEVVDGLGRFIVGSLELFAGNLSFDLADLLGGLGGGLGIPGLDGMAIAPRLVSSTPLRDADGAHPEGLYSLGMSLFAEPAP